MFIGLSLALVLLAGAGFVLIWEGEVKHRVPWVAALLVCSVATGAAGLFLGPKYSVWQQGMAGKAALTRAEQDRQIRVEEAKAENEAAKLQAEAEVARARGAAEANEIMAESLGGADRYLRWRWIVMLENNAKASIHREIIYVPADGSMPLSEAGRAVVPAQPASETETSAEEPKGKKR